MGNPITPASVKAIVPAVQAKVCDALVKALLAFPALFYRIYSWMFNADATASDEFKLDVNYIQPGDVISSARPSTTRTGFLICGGQAVSRTEFATLYAAIGTTYGAGDGFMTFNVPDIAGRTIVGSGAGSGLTARTLASKFGEEGHVQTESELVPHTHAVVIALGDNNDDSAAPPSASNGNPVGVSDTVTSASTGGGEAANVCQPSTVLHYFIKT